ncbi:hypothetical protein H2203_000549 [Taxawa tesnikishii (nom. ined.)]|nr:hypothetical protein H2203_000549 [Dothideales sp. JES 119]
MTIAAASVDSTLSPVISAPNTHHYAGERPLNPRDPILALFNAKQEEFDNAEAAMFNAWNDKKEDIEHETSSLDFLAEQRPTINLTKSPPPFHHTRSTSIPHARGKRWKRNKRKHNHQPKHSSQDSQLYDRADLGMKSNSNNFRSLNCIRKRRLRTKRARDRRKRQREAAATSLVVRWERRDGRLQFVRKRKKNEGGEEEKARSASARGTDSSGR